jgi:predicted MFS family arabinose efflux permease
MEKFRINFDKTIWTRNLLLMASAVFLQRFGEALVWATRTNFFIETVGLSGGHVLWLEGIREIPGLGLMFIAALTMRLPLSQRSAASLLIMGVGYSLYAVTNSYLALIAVAIIASLGMHMWMPLRSTLAMCLTTKDKTGRVLGSLASVGALASLAGMGILSLISKIFESISLRAYFIGSGVFIIAAAFLIFRIPTQVGATEVKPPRMLLSYRYWLYYVLTFLDGARKQILDSFGMLMLVDKFGLKVWNISSLLLVSSVLNMISGPYVGRLIDRYGERRMVPLSYILLSLCCVGFATIPSVWILALMLISIKLMIMFGMGLSTYVRRISPQEELTPTLSAGISINHITSVAMPLVSGALLPIIGYEGVFLGTAALITLSLPFALALRVSPGASQVDSAE